MLLRITNLTAPADDLGFLLHKHPERVQAFDLPFGKAHVFYADSEPDRCTAVLLLDVDPIGLVRKRGGRGGSAFPLAQYVNDRPYAASSFLSVAIARVLNSALKGSCPHRPELVDTKLSLEAEIPVLPCRGGEVLARKLFEPLGYEVETKRLDLDPEFPEWGAGPYLSLVLRGEQRVADLLSHLYVLIPVTDDAKHYWVSRDEVEKLLRRGEGWLADHPEKELITERYLAHQRSLARAALARLLLEEDEGENETRAEEEEAKLERKLRLADVRVDAVADALLRRHPNRVIDLGCGEGKLLRRLIREKGLDAVVGVDVSHRCLEIAASRLRLDRMPDRKRERIDLIHGSLTYRDDRFAGFDAAACAEVIEHIDPGRLPFFERVVFEFARPGVVVLTTPNAEYNARFEGMAPGAFRHRDHRFEWTRKEFAAWASGVAERHGYSVTFEPVGDDDPEVGPPTQMGVFTR
jgi:3' terminal RNA ribose 2'-O-methyltransferase Hen1